ncbi:Arginase, catabolizes arginine to ornithine and urea, partial [Ceratobasidium sp. 423]
AGHHPISIALQPLLSVGTKYRHHRPASSGVDRGPIHLVDAGLERQLTTLGWKVKFDDHPQSEGIDQQRDTPLDPQAPRLVSKVCEIVPKVIGDHARQAMRTISGMSSPYPDACIIYFGAHADIDTPSTSTSGNIHGMPLSFFLGIAGGIHKVVSGPQPFSRIKSILRPERLDYIGPQNPDEAEKNILREHGIRAYNMYEVDQYRIGCIVELARD